MSEPLNILLVEDSEDDALLLLREIRRGGYDPLYERVETPEEFRAALSKRGWDIVISDYSLPRFGGMDALRLLKESGEDIPFIIVSGIIGEGALVDAMKAGADDYVLKDNMARLTQAIRRELCEAEVRRERRLAQAAFRESEERYRRLVENANDIVATADLDGRIISMNSAIKRIAGYEPEEIVGEVFFSFLTPRSQERAREMMRAKIENRAQGTTYEIQIIAKDGGVVDAEVSSKLMIKGGQPVGVEAIMRDITARKKAEERLSLLATAIESTYESVIITDAAGVIQYVNPSFERVSGYGMEEAVGKRPGDLIRSGRHSGSFYRDMWSTISGGGVWKGRIVNRKKKGEFYEEDSTISPVFDSSGAIINYVAVSKDVTQEVLLEKQFLQAQKMEALGTLAGGIAHDFNNILFAILGYTDLAIKELKDGSEVREYLTKVSKAGRRAKDLVQQILLFGRKSESELAPVQLHLLVSEALKLLHISLPPNIEIRSDVEKSSDIAMANPTQVHQVIINLCANAIHAMEDRGGRPGGRTSTGRCGRGVREGPSRSSPRPVRQAFGDGHGPRHSPGNHRQDIRPFLHHEGGWKGDRAGACRRARHRRAP